MSMKTITNDIFSSLVSSSKTTGYDTTATVTRIDNDGVCWVHIDGGVAETPTSMAVNAIPGDIVRVRVSGGDAWITGNDSKPPTDDAEAFVANRKAVTAQSYAEIAQENAEQAQITADEANTNAISAIDIANIAQGSAISAREKADYVTEITSDTIDHFWVQSSQEEGADNGVHITDIGYREFLDTKTGKNVLIKSEGIAIRDGLQELAHFSQNGVNFYNESGLMAHYGQSVQIGPSDGMHIEMTSGSNAELGFFDGEIKVAYINNNTLHIGQSIILNEMQLGSSKWTWKIDPTDNSIYLKWIGIE